jgi:CHASE2 domain-containing sensor protein/signal transduction histidine kinase
LPRLRLAFEWLTIALLAALAAIGIAYTAGGQQLSNWLFDRELGWSQHEVDPRILIVAIDEQSLASFGRWPWPRAVHARIVDRLTEGGVAAVGYDVLFTEPGVPDDDAELTVALRRSGRVAIPAYAEFPGSNGRAFDVQMPLADIGSAARTIGHVNVQFDSDGQVRRARVQSAERPQHMPHLMQALAGDLLGVRPAIPSEPVIPFVSAGSYPVVPADAILRGEVPPELLKGRIVLVGATAQGMGDTLPVSGAAGSVMPGVEVQANLLDAILHRSWVRDAGAQLAAGLAIVLLLIVMAAYWQVSPNRGLAITLLLGLAALGLSAATLAAERLWITPLPLLVGLLLAYPLWNWRRLAALNAFVEQETRSLNLDLGLRPTARRSLTGMDKIASAAGQLRSVIGELRDRRSFLRDTIESAPDALCVLDSNRQVVMANRLAIELFGPEAEGSDLPILLTRIVVSEDTRDDELVFADGRTMLAKTAPFSADVEGAAGSIVRFADITARRRAERERDEALEFLSHDLRSPQAAILTTLETAPAAGDIQPALARIRRYAQRTLKLADDFVQLARLATITPRRDLVDLTGIFDEAIDGLYDQSVAGRVTLSLEVADELAPILADAALLIRAVSNLLDNAVKYSPPDSPVDCRIVQDGAAQLVATIADGGPGIPPERLAALFERFGPNDPGAGLSAGLGLAFVKRVVELHGGKIACQSDSTGTTFKLIFPLAPDPESAELE